MEKYTFKKSDSVQSSISGFNAKASINIHLYYINVHAQYPVLLLLVSKTEKLLKTVFGNCWNKIK